MSTWWNENWPYRTRIEIKNDYVDETLNGPVVRVPITTDMAIGSQPLGSDIRFTTKDG